MRRYSLHPFLFALYPVLALLAHNAGQLRLAEGVRALIVAVGGAGVLFAILRLILRDTLRAALVCTLAVALLFSYGHIYQWLGGLGPLGQMLGRHRYLIPVSLVVMLAGSLAIVRGLKDPAPWTAGLNIAGLALLILPVAQTVAIARGYPAAQASSEQLSAAECELHPTEGQALPDIYYIILDGYARQDVLADTYNYDNQPFLDQLTQRGFYVAEWAQSNYFNTQLSLSSSLSYEYLDLLLRNELARMGRREQVSAMRDHGAVRRNLECLGYTIVAFDSSSPASSWRDADVFLSPQRHGVQSLALSGMNAFEAMLFNTTAGLVLSDASIAIPQWMRPDVDLPMREHRQRVQFAFDTIGDGVPGLTSPKFVFAHVVAPHTPYAFGPNGEAVDPGGTFTLQSDSTGASVDNDLAGYRNNVIYVSKEVLEAVDGILSRSARPPIIIIQGDHGTYGDAHSRMSILSAFYLPGGGQVDLYPTITPVNTFRIIFNHYLGGQYELLPDISYYSTDGSHSNLLVFPNPHAPGSALQ